MRVPRILLLALTGVLFLAATACRSGEDESPLSRAPRPTGPIQVEVQNNNFLDVTVYAMDNGQNIRLGNVTGKQSETLTLDPRRLSPGGTLRLLVDPIGASDAFLSDRVVVGSGQRVFLQIGAVLSQSYVILR